MRWNFPKLGTAQKRFRDYFMVNRIPWRRGSLKTGKSRRVHFFINGLILYHMFIGPKLFDSTVFTGWSYADFSILFHSSVFYPRKWTGTNVYGTLQRKSHLCIPFLGLRRLSPNFHIHVSVIHLYSIFPGSVHIFGCSKIDRPILEIYKSLTDIYLSVGIGRQSITILFWN